MMTLQMFMVFVQTARTFCFVAESYTLHTLVITYNNRVEEHNVSNQLIEMIVQQYSH